MMPFYYQVNSEGFIRGSDRCVPAPMCSRTNVSPHRCVPTPMCLHVDVSRHQYVSTPMCPRINVSPQQCVPEPMCPRTNVSPRQCVPAPICPRTNVSPHRCFPARNTDVSLGWFVNISLWTPRYWDMSVWGHIGAWVYPCADTPVCICMREIHDSLDHKQA